MKKKVIFSWVDGFYGFSLFSDMKETDVEKDAILTQEDATAFGYENVEQLARAIVGGDPRNVWREGNQIDTSVELDGNDTHEVIRQLLKRSEAIKVILK